MKLRHELTNNFEEYLVALENEQLKLTEYPSNYIKFTDAFDIEISELTVKVFKESRQLFLDYDYDWIKYSINFSSPFEQLHQLLLVDTLADISAEHPDYKNFGNICIRIVGTSNMNAEAVQYKGGKYICISTSYIKYVKQFLHAFYQISLIGQKEFADEYETFDGKYAFLALEHKYSECKPIISELIELAYSYVNYETPRSSVFAPPILTSSNIEELNDQFAAHLSHDLIGSDLFLIFHELSHCVKHNLRDNERCPEDEIDADYGASSLSIILTARHEKYIHSYLRGPAIFFTVFRHFNLLRRTFMSFEHDKNIHPFDIKEEMKSEFELRQRSEAYGEYIKRNFLFLDSDSEIEKKYHDTAQGMFVLIAGTQLELLKSLKPDKSLNIKDILPKFF